MEIARRTNWKFWLRMVISLTLLAWFFISFDWKDIIAAFRGITLSWLLAAVLWIIISVLVSTVKWQIVLRAQGLNLGFQELWQTYWAGLFFNNFLPSSIGGDTLRILWTGKAANDNPGATASVIVERVLATVGLAVVGVFGCLLVPKAKAEVAILFAILILGSCLLLAVLFLEGNPSAARTSRVMQFLTELKVHGQKIGKSPKAILLAVLWSAAFQLCVIAVNYCIFRGLGLSLAWKEAIYVIPATSVAAMLPFGINGYGVREGAYIVLLAPFGISAARAIASSMIFAFLVSICSLWGGVVWLTRTQQNSRGSEIEEVG